MLPDPQITFDIPQARANQLLGDPYMINDD